MEFLHSLLRPHLVGKPVVALQNVICFLRLYDSNVFIGVLYAGLLIFCGRKSKISRDFQGQIHGKIGRFRGKKVKIRGKIGRFRGICVGEKSKFAEKSFDFGKFYNSIVKRS